MMRKEETMDIREEKKRQRRLIKERITGLSSSRRQSESEAAAAAVLETDLWNRAATLLCYIPMPEEIDTGPIMEAALKEGKALGLPRMEGARMEFRVPAAAGTELSTLYSRLERHPYGIWEPPESAPLFRPEDPAALPALVITPGLGFDREMRRLGRGKGFYDRWFSAHRRLMETGKIGTMGLGFSVQLLRAIPAEAHDFRLNRLVIAGREWRS